MAELNIEMPEKGTGSGKNGSIIKKDIARKLERFLFPQDDEAGLVKCVKQIAFSSPLSLYKMQVHRSSAEKAIRVREA